MPLRSHYILYISCTVLRVPTPHKIQIHKVIVHDIQAVCYEPPWHSRVPRKLLCAHLETIGSFHERLVERKGDTLRIGVPSFVADQARISEKLHHKLADMVGIGGVVHELDFSAQRVFRFSTLLLRRPVDHGHVACRVLVTLWHGRLGARLCHIARRVLVTLCHFSVWAWSLALLFIFCLLLCCVLLVLFLRLPGFHQL